MKFGEILSKLQEGKSSKKESISEQSGDIYADTCNDFWRWNTCHAFYP